MHRPRVMIAGTKSGSGKTTVCLSILSALKKRGLSPASFKSGPDYIDPMFHESVLGVKSSNLDLFFCDGSTVRSLFLKNSRGADISVIEGAMGYYDGLGIASEKASAYDLACALGAPAILVLDCRGASLSILAEIEGFVRFRKESGVRGVILNRCSSRVYEKLQREIKARFQGRVLPLGYFPSEPEVSFPSRHLGLVQACELEEMKEKLSLLGDRAEKTLDIDGIIALARGACVLLPEEAPAPWCGKVRVAVARDEAFGFYYRDNLALLEEMGAQIVPFSPLRDERLPDAVDGLYLGGGYPELHLKALSKNQSMKESVRDAVAGGLPTIAECGGFMYLLDRVDGFKMAGVIRGEAADRRKLMRFGYVTLKALEDGMLFKKGEEIPAHEFHYYDSTHNGESMQAEKTDGRSWRCVIQTKTLYAGYPHFHFYADSGRAAGRFMRACLKERRRRERDSQTK